MKKFLSIVLVLSMTAALLALFNFSTVSATESEEPEVLGSFVTVEKALTDNTYFMMTSQSGGAFSGEDVVDGLLTFSLEIFNLSDKNFNVTVSLQAEVPIRADGSNTWTTPYTVEGATPSLLKTVPAHGKATITVTAKVNEEGKIWFRSDSANREVFVTPSKIFLRLNFEEKHLDVGTQFFMKAEKENSAVLKFAKSTTFVRETIMSDTDNVQLLDVINSRQSVAPGDFFLDFGTFTQQSTYFNNPQQSNSPSSTVWDEEKQSYVLKFESKTAYHWNSPGVAQATTKLIFSKPGYYTISFDIKRQNAYKSSPSVLVRGSKNVSFGNTSGLTKENEWQSYSMKVFVSEENVATIQSSAERLAFDSMCTCNSCDGCKANYEEKGMTTVYLDNFSVQHSATKKDGSCEDSIDGFMKFSQTKGDNFERVKGGANGTDYALLFKPSTMYSTAFFDLGGYIVDDESHGYEGEGAGTYKLTFWAKSAVEGKTSVFDIKLNSQRHMSKEAVQGVLGTDVFTGDTFMGINKRFTMTDEWQKCEVEFSVTYEWLNMIKSIQHNTRSQSTYQLCLRLDGNVEDGGWKSNVYDYLIDEISIEKVSDIKAANVEVSEDLTLNYYARIDEGHEAAQLYLNFAGKDYVIDGTKVEGNDVYNTVFTFEGIGPHLMNETVTAKIKLPNAITDHFGEKIIAYNTYSLKEYCTNVYSKDATDVQKALLADLLAYGKAAGEYVGYENTVEIPEDITPTEFTTVTDAVRNVENTDSNNYVKSAGLRLANVNRIYFRMVLTDDCTVYLGDEDVTSQLIKDGETYLYYTDGLSITENAKVHVLTVKNAEGETISTVEYNVNAYIQKNCNQESALGNLVRALYNASESARTYNN